MCGQCQSFHRPTCSGGTSGGFFARMNSIRCGCALGFVTQTWLNSTQLSPGCGSLVGMPTWSNALRMRILRDEDDAEAEAGRGRIGRTAVAVGGAAGPGVAAPRTAAQHPLLTLRRPRRVAYQAVLIRTLAVPVRA